MVRVPVYMATSVGAVLLSLAVSMFFADATPRGAYVLKDVQLSGFSGGLCKWIVPSVCPDPEADCTTHKGPNACDSGHRCMIESYKDQYDTGWFTCEDSYVGNQGCQPESTVWCTEIVFCADTCDLVNGQWQCENDGSGGLDQDSQHSDQIADGPECPGI